jgi:CheY-like chemotaxis protein
MKSVSAEPVALAARESAATDTKVLWNLVRCLTDPMARGYCVQEQKMAGQFQIPVRLRGKPRLNATMGTCTVMNAHALVSIVDDDESVRESLPDLVRQFGFAAQAFSSAEAFLASEFVDETRCLILDIAMPGMSGPELQRELKNRQKPIPIIFITANGDRSVRSRLLAEGGVECLFKPFSDTALLDALTTVFPKSEI